MYASCRDIDLVDTLLDTPSAGVCRRPITIYCLDCGTHTKTQTSKQPLVDIFDNIWIILQRLMPVLSGVPGVDKDFPIVLVLLSLSVLFGTTSIAGPSCLILGTGQGKAIGTHGR